ncbi:MAG: hypothetical protein Q8Q07_04370 [Dehalococcoidales bacterium]|nr:hypothetical protein [Dehalococcoidales bacterium]
MESGNENTPQSGEEGETTSIWDDIRDSPELQKAIAQITDLIKANLEAKNTILKLQLETQSSTTRGATKWILSVMAIVTFVIVGAVSFLAWQRIMSSDAVSFLFGTLTGAIFAFLGRFFPK